MSALRLRPKWITAQAHSLVSWVKKHGLGVGGKKIPRKDFVTCDFFGEGHEDH
jgi:hypothetical protein